MWFLHNLESIIKKKIASQYLEEIKCNESGGKVVTDTHTYCDCWDYGCYLNGFS